MIFEAPPTPRPKRLRKLPEGCADSRCDLPHAEGSRFCVAHRDRLAAVRDDLNAARQVIRDSYGKPKRRLHAPPTCCSLGCMEPREKGRAFCPACMAAGCVEETT
jgi:hypothetical protein